MSQCINRIDEIIERVSKMSKWDLKTSLVNHELAYMDAQSRIKMLEAKLAKAGEVIKSANGDVVLGSPSQKLIEDYLYGEAEWVFSEQGEKE